MHTGNLPKCLAEFGVKDGTRLTADDFLQNYTLVLNIIHRWTILCFTDGYWPTGIIWVFHSSESLPDEKEFMVVTEEEQQEETKGIVLYANGVFLTMVFVFLEEERVDLSVRKRKAPPGDGDEPVLQNAAKRIKDDVAAAAVQEI